MLLLFFIRQRVQFLLAGFVLIGFVFICYVVIGFNGRDGLGDEVRQPPGLLHREIKFVISLDCPDSTFNEFQVADADLVLPPLFHLTLWKLRRTLQRLNQRTATSRLHVIRSEHVEGGAGGERLGLELLHELAADLFVTAIVIANVTPGDQFAAKRPCLMLFWDERRLPSGVTGPRERAPLARDAAIWAGVRVVVAGG